MAIPSVDFMAALRFTSDELALNRGGELSASQNQYYANLRALERESLAAASRTSPRLVVLLVLLLLLAGGLIYLFLREELMQFVSGLGSNALPVGIGIVVLVILVFAYARRSYREMLETVAAMADENKPLPPVKVVSGKVTTRKEDRYGGRSGRGDLDRRVIATLCYAMISSPEGVVKIMIPEAGMYAFVPNQEYAVYYCDDGVLNFLSAELKG